MWDDFWIFDDDDLLASQDLEVDDGIVWEMPAPALPALLEPDDPFDPAGWGIWPWLHPTFLAFIDEEEKRDSKRPRPRRLRRRPLFFGRPPFRKIK